MTAIEVNHRIDGPEDAPVLVLANSLATDMRLWDSHVPALAERFRVVRYDHRGHGGSPVPDGPYSMTDLSDDVLALLDRLEIDRASFCGVSLGGMVGMALASRAPDRIDRLVLCCTSASMGAPEVWKERIATVREQGTAAVVDGTLGRWFTERFLAANPPEVALAREMILATPDEGYAACGEAIAPMDQLEAIRAISAPTLVLTGADDPSTPADPHGEAIRQRISGSTLKVIPDASHMAVLEQPDAVRTAILGHLDGLGS
jgi:3-oxoadipate enol-lactonase